MKNAKNLSLIIFENVERMCHVMIRRLYIGKVHRERRPADEEKHFARQTSGEKVGEKNRDKEEGGESVSSDLTVCIQGRRPGSSAL